MRTNNTRQREKSTWWETKTVAYHSLIFKLLNHHELLLNRRSDLVLKGGFVVVISRVDQIPNGPRDGGRVMRDG